MDRAHKKVLKALNFYKNWVAKDCMSCALKIVEEVENFDNSTNIEGINTYGDRDEDLFRIAIDYLSM